MVTSRLSNKTIGSIFGYIDSYSVVDDDQVWSSKILFGLFKFLYHCFLAFEIDETFFSS